MDVEGTVCISIVATASSKMYNTFRWLFAHFLGKLRE